MISLTVMMVTTNYYKENNLDVFDTRDEMEAQLTFYTEACPNVKIQNSGYDMDLGFFIIWKNYTKPYI